MFSLIFQSFHSLQTGKTIQRIDRLDLYGRYYPGFNSLQTGTRIQRAALLIAAFLAVRFNSLQTGKWIQSLLYLTRQFSYTSFHSLQTGKRSQSKVMDTRTSRTGYVSIPLKRERVAKGLAADKLNNDITKFPFPSNGNADPKTKESPTQATK